MVRRAASIHSDALLESFLLHMRDLREFLYKDASREQGRSSEYDVRARDYFDSRRTWEEGRQPEGDALKIAMKHVGSRLAHISYRRVKDGKQGWECRGITRDITKAVDDFRARAKPSLLDQCWDSVDDLPEPPAGTGILSTSGGETPGWTVAVRPE